MTIEIVSDNIDHNSIILDCKKFYPEWKINDSEESSTILRLFKKLVRQKSYLLKKHNIHLNVTCPIFMYYFLNSLLHHRISIQTIPTEDITFETSDDFGSEDESNLFSIFKKIKTATKDINPNLIKYFLPMSTHIRFVLLLDILEIYELIINLSKQSNDKKIKEFRNLLVNLLYEHDDLIFNDQLLEVSTANKE